MTWIKKWIRSIKKKPKKVLRIKTPIDKDYLEQKEAARDLVHQRIEAFQCFGPFEFNVIRIKKNKRSWGSCSIKKNLNFNYKLVQIPLELADYIIVHELCHLRELNHSPRFWRHVESILPNHKELRRELRKFELNLRD